MKIPEIALLNKSPLVSVTLDNFLEQWYFLLIFQLPNVGFEKLLIPLAISKRYQIGMWTFF